MVEKRRKYRAYQVMLAIYLLFAVFAFVLDSPMDIVRGSVRILTSRSVLITDYMAVGGVGATLLNAAIVGMFSILVLLRIGIRPNGSTLMALWLSTGFAMFGKNLLNMIPITFGVWLYTKVRREPLINYSLAILLSATMSPVVSGIAFYQGFPLYVGLPLGVVTGVLAGFIFSPVSSFTVRVHGGYDLYNMGFAGGLISTFICSGFAAVGYPLENELHWSTGHNLPLSILLYLVSAGLIVFGLFAKGRFERLDYRRLMSSSGRLVSDYLVTHGYGAYVNMGVLGVIATTITLALGADLNGPTLCGIFTVIGFGAFGKHPRNVAPLLIGAVACTIIGHWTPTNPANILAILFCTGLAPIAGQFGWGWGIVTGFLHVNTVMHIGFLNSGLNLYNNGYAAGFVALLLVPIIMAFQRDKHGAA